MRPGVPFPFLIFLFKRQTAGEPNCRILSFSALHKTHELPEMAPNCRELLTNCNPNCRIAIRIAELASELPTGLGTQTQSDHTPGHPSTHSSTARAALVWRNNGPRHGPRFRFRSTCEKQSTLPGSATHCVFMCGGTRLQCLLDFLPVWDRQGGNSA